MLNLEACTALSHVELYEQFALLMQEAGLDGLAGQTVAQVSTEEFEYWTDSFVQNKDNETRLRALFNSFERRMKRNQRMLDRTDQRGLEKVA